MESKIKTLIFISNNNGKHFKNKEKLNLELLKVEQTLIKKCTFNNF